MISSELRQWVLVIYGYTNSGRLIRSRTNTSENVMNKYDEEAFIREMQHKHMLNKCKARPLEYKAISEAQEALADLKKRIVIGFVLLSAVIFILKVWG